MKKSESIKELATALSKAQGAMKGAVKDAANPFFKSKYADLASVWDACRSALEKNGLSVAQGLATSEQGKVRVTTLLMHTSGEWLESECEATPVKQDPQGFGSASTYLRRYGLQAMVGIAPEDDDGEAATGRRPMTAGPVHPQQPEPGDGFTDPDPTVILYGKFASRRLAEVNFKDLSDYAMWLGEQVETDKMKNSKNFDKVLATYQQIRKYVLDVEAVGQ